MSVPLIPQRVFTVVRQITNHTDTATYYVRAVIRNAYTDAIIDTLNLTDKGGQRFKYDWQVPADPSGQGFYVSIVTSVYTDSGYTTKSENYGDEESTYLVSRNSTQGRLGGAGSGVDSFTVRSIIQEELDKRKPEPVTFPTIPTPKEYEMRWDEVFGAIAEVRDAIDRIQPTNLSTVYAQLDTLKRAIEEKEVTPPTDLTPVLDKLNEDTDTGEVNHQDVKDNLTALEGVLVKAIKENIEDSIAHTKFVTQMTTGAVRDNSPKQETSNGQMYDLKNLAK